MGEACPRCGAWLIETNDGYVCLVTRCGWGPSFTGGDGPATRGDRTGVQQVRDAEKADVTLPADVANDIGAELRRLRAQVAAVEALADEAERATEVSLSRMFNGDKFPAHVSADAIRAALEQP